MGEWRVQRTNRTAGRFEWLRARPDFVPGDPTATPPTEDAVTARWTWQDPGDPTGWRNGNAPFDFGRKRAEAWAKLVDGDDVIAVRVGAPDADETIDPAALALARVREARREYREALAAGEADPL